MKEHLTFLREFKRNFQTTGALLPSSPALSRAVAEEIPKYEGSPRNILELGAGTGVITRRILPRLGPDDRFVVYEISEVLMGYLRSRLEGQGHWSRWADRVELRNRPFPEGAEENFYDVVVSGLPLNNTDGKVVDGIFRAVFQSLAPGGCFIFYEYCFIRGLKRPFVGPRHAVRLRRIERVMKRYLDRYEVKRKTVFGNIPPAWVHVLRNEPT